MNLELLFTGLATLIALAFTALVTAQYLRKRRPYQLIWALALLMFTVATGAQAYAALLGWDPAAYRVWYLFGAVLAVAYLGLGSLWLQVSMKVSWVVTVILVGFSLVAVWNVFTVPINMQAAFSGDRVTGAGFPESTRLIFTPILNAFGTVLLVGGALWSAWKFVERGGLGRRAVGLILLAAGALVVAAGSLLERFGVPQPFSAALLVGIAVMASGFAVGLR